jgi:HEAT repeat protein
MTQPLDTLLEEITTGSQTPEPGRLYYLSNLEAEDVTRVKEAWSQIPVDLRRALTARLVEVAEADFEVNFGAVFRLGLDDEDAQVRTLAVEGLWEDNDVRLIPRLVSLLGDEAVPVRAAAATSLGRFVLLGELGKIRTEPFRKAYDALLATCQSGEEHMEPHRRALESLSYVGNIEVVKLIQAAYDSPEEKMLVSAVFSMGRSADPRWAESVKHELFNPSPELRYEAARACGELQLSDAVLSLEELTDDADPEVQEAALWALGQIGGDKAREILEHFCEAESEATRAAAEAALDELEFMHGDLNDFFARLAGEQDLT